MSKIDLSFQNPIMNAAGSLGFSPDFKSRIDLSNFGAFVTNPVSWLPRAPAKGIRTKSFTGGLLLHTGYPNPGMRAVLRHHAKHWARSPIPIIVHLLASDAVTLGRMVQQLEGMEGVMGIEVGLPPEADPNLVDESIQAAVGELPVILRLPLESVLSIHGRTPLLEVITSRGISAVSLAPPRGTVADRDGSLVSGRLYGPAQGPLVLTVVKHLVGLFPAVIAGGGIYTCTDVDILLAAGAMAVQLDTVLWSGGLIPYSSKTSIGRSEMGA